MEIYIKTIEDPNYTTNQLEVGSEVQMLLTQIENLIFTKRGDVLGDADFGLNLEDYVYSFSYNDNMLKGYIEKSISTYIPLASKYNVNVNVEFATETERNLVFVDIVIDNTFGIQISL
jgi:hypothetical protein